MKNKENTYDVICDNCPNLETCKALNSSAIFLKNSNSKSILKFIKENNLKHILLKIPDTFKEIDTFICLINKIKKSELNILLEINIPPTTNEKLIKLIKAKPDIISINIDNINYDHKLISIFQTIKEINPRIITKSIIELNFNEYNCQVMLMLAKLKTCYVDIVTLGQGNNSICPIISHKKYNSAKNFIKYKKFAKKLNFMHVISEPNAKCSYKTIQGFFV